MNSINASRSERSFQRPNLSIVVPAYNEDGNIGKLYSGLLEAMLKVNILWEIIFIDDGSTDNTWSLIRDLHTRDSRVKGIHLSRNFGHQYALFAGLSLAKGDAVITMDADLQHPPELIPKIIKAWHKGYLIVNTQRSDKEQVALFKRVTSKLFYSAFSALSGFKLVQGMADFRLFDRSVVDKLLRFPEHHLFFRGLVQWIGFNSYTIKFDCQKRFSGKTKYSLIKMLNLAWSGLTSFSVLPLRLATILGIITSLFSFSGLLYALFSKYFLLSAVPGWTSLLSYVSLLFGVLFLLLGVLGEYIARILEQVRGRPRFLVEDQIGDFSKSKKKSDLMLVESELK